MGNSQRKDVEPRIAQISDHVFTNIVKISERAIRFAKTSKESLITQNNLNQSTVEAIALPLLSCFKAKKTNLDCNLSPKDNQP
jgi:hypothetical protein